jgi:hypothetical protein
MVRRLPHAWSGSAGFAAANGDQREGKHSFHVLSHEFGLADPTAFVVARELAAAT